MAKRGGCPAQIITFDGKSMSAEEWANELHITASALRTRLRRWPIERALTMPKLVGNAKRPKIRLPHNNGGGWIKYFVKIRKAGPFPPLATS